MRKRKKTNENKSLIRRKARISICEKRKEM